MKTVYYDHNTRKVTMLESGGNRVEIGVEKARRLWESNQIADCNMAFMRLVLCEFDFEEVDRQYKELDGLG